jgi:hypothetical protein
VRVDSLTARFGGTIFNRGIAAFSTSFALSINPEGKLQANLSDRSTTNTWTAMGNPVLATNSTTCSYEAVTPDQPQRFYRVIRLP